MLGRFGYVILVTVVIATATMREAAADCTCRAQGRDFDLGRSVCMMTPSGYRLATCDMVLNNTSWKISSTPCVDAEAPRDDRARKGVSHRHGRHTHRHGG
jgi:hypothetical protein